jgi:hypothetical protein
MCYNTPENFIAPELNTPWSICSVTFRVYSIPKSQLAHRHVSIVATVNGDRLLIVRTSMHHVCICMQAVFGWMHFLLMLICYERKILFYGWLILTDKLKRI